MLVWLQRWADTNVTLAFEDVIPLFSREETDDTDDTDDTGWYRLKGDSMSKVREKRSTSKSGFFLIKLSN